MAEPIRVGISGLGRSGWNIHAKAISQFPNYKVVAVADPEEERQNEAVALFGCQTYTTPEDMFQDPAVELVVVATPSFTHAPLAIKAMRAGKHVLVEKPMATNLTEVDEMIKVQQETGQILTVFQNRRLDPDFVQLQSVIDSGVLGPIHLIKLSRHGYQRRNDWQTLIKNGGGQLNNWGAHVVDHALILLGGEYQEIFVDLQHTVSAGDAEDHVKLVLKGMQGTVVDVEVTSSAAFGMPEYVVMGKYGGLRGTPKEMTWRYYRPEEAPPLSVQDGPAAGRAYGSGEKLPWIDEQCDVKGEGPTPLFYQKLYETIRKGAPLFVTPESVRSQIELFEKARELSGM